jgi:membrane fusion protein, multidrug efflux system
MKRPGLRKYFFIYGAALAVACVLILAARLYAQSSQQAIAEQRRAGLADSHRAEIETTRVKVFRVFPMPIEDILTLPGNIEASADVHLAAPVGGIVAWIGVREGDRAERGSTILRLDMGQYEAQLREARTNFALAAGNRADMEKLFEQNIVSRSERNEAIGLAERARALVEAQIARVREGQIDAPIGGVIDRVSVEVGEHVNAGQPVIRLVDIDRVKAVLNVPEKDIVYFSPGQSVELAAVAAGEEYRVAGVIDHVALTADPISRTYPVKVLVENPQGRLRPGMIVSARLVRHGRPDALALPFFTVMDREGGSVVFVAESGHAYRRRVETRAIQGGLVEIISGLEQGEAVIVVGQRSLTDGEPITVVDDLTEAARRMLEQGADLAALPLELTP